MQTHPTLCLVVSWVLCDCADAPVEPTEPTAADPFVLAELPQVGDGKADGASSSVKQETLQRMKARLPTQRRLKADLLVGETVDGYVATPPGASPPRGPDHVREVAAFLAAENGDRSAYYEWILAGHERTIRQNLQAQRQTMREQVVAELCQELPPGVPCAEVAAPAIDEALEIAFEASIDVALVPIRAEVERVHGQFWQDRTTRDGEWIEVDDGVWDHRGG